MGVAVQNDAVGLGAILSGRPKSRGSAAEAKSGKGETAHREVDSGEAVGGRTTDGGDEKHGNDGVYNEHICQTSHNLAGTGSNVTHSRDNKHAIHNKTTSFSKDVKSMY